MIAFETNPVTLWKLVGTVPTDEFRDQAAGVLQPMIWTVLAVLVLATAISYVVARLITRPIKHLQEMMKAVENGNLLVAASIRRKDEIGQLGASFNEMVDNMRAMMQVIAQTSDQVSLASRTLLAGATENMAVANEVAVTMQEIASGAGSQSALVEHNATVAQTLAQQIGQVEQEGEELERLSGGMLESSRAGIGQMAQLREHSRQSMEMSGQVSEAIVSLSHTSGQIGSIVDTIAQITRQTNILAMNAAIEAARAGEHGRGFGVVADEVRKLAQQSEEALSRIGDLIEAIQRETERAVDWMEKAGVAIRKQETAATDTDRALISIAESIEMSSASISQVMRTMREMIGHKEVISDNTQQLHAISQETTAGTEEVSASVEEQSASMEQLNKLASDLEAYAGELRAELSRFTVE